MAYIEVTTTGPIEWAIVFEGNRDMTGYDGNFVECDGAYTVQQKLTKDDFAKLQGAGSTKKPAAKHLMDGEIIVKFVRKHKVTKKDGTIVAAASGAPKVFDKDGNIWKMEDGLIGNGSIAEVKNLVSTFKTADGKPAARTSLMEIKILEHVPVEEKEEENSW